MGARDFNFSMDRKELFPFLPAWGGDVKVLKVPYIVDYDDAIFHNYDLHSANWCVALGKKD